jgi:hypothetical protein
VKGCSNDVGHVEEGGKAGPERGNKLGTAVRSNGMGKAKTGNPNGTEGICTGTGGGGRKRNSFYPAGGPVDDCENVGVTLRGRKGTNQVNMDVGKTAGGKRNGCRRGRNVVVDFGSLARNTLSGPEVDIPSHPVPKEAGGKQASGGSDTRMT